MYFDTLLLFKSQEKLNILLHFETEVFYGYWLLIYFIFG